MPAEIVREEPLESDAYYKTVLRRITVVSTAVTAGISWAAIFGWALNWLIIARINPDYIPMAPSTALCFILLSMGLLFYVRRPEYNPGRMAVIIGTVLVLLISAVPLAGFFAGTKFEIEHFPFKPVEIAKIPIGHMSPITAVNFLLSSFAILLLVVPPANRQRAKSAATSLVTIVFFVGLILLLGYLYKTPLLYGGTIIPVALPTSVAFVFLSAGIIAAAGPYYWPINLFIGSSVRARLMRSFFPSVIAIMIFAGWVDTMIFPWLNNHVLTTSLVIISSMIIIGIIVSRIAKVVGGDIDRAITERKQLEASLKVQSRRFEAFFENTITSLAFLDRDFNFIRVNKAYADADKKEISYFPGQNHFELYPSDAKAIFDDVVRTKTSFQAFARPFVYPDHPDLGVTFWDWTLVPILDNTGEVEFLVLSLVDVTKGKKTEELIKNILESVDEGFIIIDRDYRIIIANRAYAGKAKMTVEDIIGKHCYKISHHLAKPCYEAGEDCAVRHVFETGESHSVIHTHYDAEGKQIYVETKAYPLSRDESGKVMTVIEILIDITEERKLEDQLRQSQKMEAIGQLTGGIAHDFNNILTAIIGYAGLMQMKMEQDDPFKLNVDQILASSERAAHLTHSLLAFSRKQVLNPKTTDLNNIINNVVKLFKRVIGEDIELEMDLLQEPLTVMADSMQIEQVLMNLATNARDAMPGGGQLTIETKKIELDEEFIKSHGYGEPGAYALMSISDNGVGMDEKTRQRIFEPFFTTKEIGKGTGLGLAMVYGIIKQHNGYINVYSEPEKGTTFKIYLSLVQSEEIREFMEEEIMPSGGTETILLAEDDESVRKFTVSMLHEFGYNVIEAVDGEDAVNKFMENKDKIRLLLFDMIMPKKSGNVAYEEIRKTRPDIKAIFSSGYTADTIQRQGLLDEGLEFISKPTAPTALMKKIRRVLDK